MATSKFYIREIKYFTNVYDFFMSFLARKHWDINSKVKMFNFDLSFRKIVELDGLEGH